MKRYFFGDSKRGNDWIYAVGRRDNWTCQDCGSIEDIQIHHIKGWADYPKLRFDVDNGKAVCFDCHAKYHPEIGFMNPKPKPKPFDTSPYFEGVLTLLFGSEWREYAAKNSTDVIKNRLLSHFEEIKTTYIPMRLEMFMDFLDREKGQDAKA